MAEQAYAINIGNPPRGVTACCQPDPGRSAAHFARGPRPQTKDISAVLNSGEYPLDRQQFLCVDRRDLEVELRGNTAAKIVYDGKTTAMRGTHRDRAVDSKICTCGTTRTTKSSAQLTIGLKIS